MAAHNLERAVWKEKSFNYVASVGDYLCVANYRHCIYYGLSATFIVKIIIIIIIIIIIVRIIIIIIMITVKKQPEKYIKLKKLLIDS